MAINWITPTEITLTAVGSYEDHDVSGITSAACTGVVYELIRPTGSTAVSKFGIRKNGSTDDFYGTGGSTANLTGGCIGVDENQIFETKQGITTGMRLFVVGYFESDAVFFTNAVDKSLGVTGSYIDIDISGDTGTDTAIGAFFQEITTSEGQDVYLRKNGSTDDFYSYDRSIESMWGVGLDGSEICEGKIASTAQEFHLVGYVTANCAWNTNLIENSLSTTSAYTDLAPLNDASSLGSCFYCRKTGSGSYFMRKNGGSDDRPAAIPKKSSTFYVACDESRLVEGWITSTAVDFYESGYFHGATPAPVGASHSAARNS